MNEAHPVNICNLMPPKKKYENLERSLHNQYHLKQLRALKFS
jgi:hypothetical protein